MDCYNWDNREALTRFETVNDVVDFVAPTMQCCDFEKWEDGTNSCTLYATGNRYENPYMYDGTDDFFACFVFESGNYTMT
mgnify:FL=1